MERESIIMRYYGYITGDFNVDTSDDVVWEFERVNQSGSTEFFLGIETVRDMASENVVIIGSNIDFMKWLNKYSDIYGYGKGYCGTYSRIKFKKSD